MPTLSLDPDALKPPGSLQKAFRITCSSCGECVQACPTGAISFAFSWSKGLCTEGSPLERLADRLRSYAGRTGAASESCFKAFIARGASVFFRFIDSILSPQALFTTSAVIFGSVVGGGFVIDTLRRLIDFAASGRFLQP